eukprot:CAMPEP_0117545060 /NCGR_PEP_ID=MMETSP0784-20121206/45900_1 /TAXON_ID=39447 /ORGANISM="" /LENGTH=341 /DNA_ID=CAMNT_0005341895 /DNA_START=99 /DNA_END=1124 /DNA_ORIENTATION=-
MQVLRASPTAAGATPTVRLLRALWAYYRARSPILAMLAGASIVSLANTILAWLRRRQAVSSERLWRRHVDLSVIQACILSTEHLATLGRVEKRTLFVKPITEVFRNEYIRDCVLKTAEEAAKSGNPMLMTQLSMEDKWHVMNTCTNHLSSCFAPYHVFFNEARRVDSQYKSAWYCFTLTCAQTSAGGRWFITPRKPVGVDDVGMLRIRIVLMNEQELREIAAGSTEAPSFGFLNGRHESRWKVCLKFSELFQRQVRSITGSDNINADWGSNLCGVKKRIASNARLNAMAEDSRLNAMTEDPHPEDNALLRLHIPFPTSSSDSHRSKNLEQDRVSKDVVLFE